MKPDKRIALEAYAANLKQRLSGPVPERHKHRPTVFKEMLEIDLKKTMNKLNGVG